MGENHCNPIFTPKWCGMEPSVTRLGRFGINLKNSEINVGISINWSIFDTSQTRLLKHTPKSHTLKVQCRLWVCIWAHLWHPRCFCLGESKSIPEVLALEAQLCTPHPSLKQKAKTPVAQLSCIPYIVFLFLDCVFSRSTRGLGEGKIFQSTKYQFRRVCVRKNSTSTSPRDPFPFSEGQPMVYWVIKAILMATQHLGKWFHGPGKK